MENHIEVMVAEISDIPRCVEICNAVWKGIFSTDPQMLITRIETFSEGGMIVGKVDGVIEGYFSFQLVNDVRFPESWEIATDSGTMKTTHCPDGEWIMGVGLATTCKGVRVGLASKLIAYGAKYMIENKKRGAYFAIRLANYKKFSETYTPEDYAIAKRNNRNLDPEVRLWEKYGFHVAKPIIIFNDYVEGGGDPNSCGHAVLIQRINQFY